MEKSIVTIIPQLLAKLPEGRPFYTQNDLSDYGYPSFLIKRIVYHVHRRLMENFNLPEEEWANTKSEELLTVWSEMERILKKEIHLPSNLAEEIVSQSARECIGMTIQPRKVIPELLFEHDEDLDSNQLTARSSAITVNRILVWSIIRYMEKKRKNHLNFDQTVKIIETIDDKIVENYHPLNWLSLVKPLFDLSGNTVHSDLLRQFFEHKGKNHIAKEFDLIDDEVKENRFIEILSSPKLIRVAGYQDEQQSLFQETADAANERAEVSEAEPEIGEELDDSDDIPIYQSFSDETEQESIEWTEKPAADDATDLIDVEKKAESGGEEMIAPWDDAPDVEKFNPATGSDLTEKEEELELKPELDPKIESEEEVEAESDIVSKYQSDQEPELQEVLDDEPEGLSIEDEEEDEVEAESDVVSKYQSDQEPELQEASDEEPEELSIEDEEDVEVESDIVSKYQSDQEPELQEASDEEPDELSIEDDEDSILRRYESESEPESEGVPIADVKLLEIEEEDEADDDESDDSILAGATEGTDTNEEEPSLLNRFMFDDSNQAEKTEPIESEPDDSLATIYDDLNLVRVDKEPKTMDLFGSVNTESSDENPSKPEPDAVDEEDDEAVKVADELSGESETILKFSDYEDPDDEGDSNDTDVPMWRAFLEREDDEMKSTFQIDADTSENFGIVEILDEDGFIEEPIYDLTKKEPELEEKIGDLSNWMLDVREKFIEELFGDSEDAYEQALSDIMEFDDWKNASRYIEKEIFTRNRVDIYEEVAVDFTDRLHTYFIENKS